MLCENENKSDGRTEKAFAANEVVNAIVAKVVKRASKLSRGDILHYETIEECAGFKRYECQWTNIVRKIRNEIRKTRGIAMRPVVNIGYKLLTEDEQLTICPRDRCKRAKRQLSRGVAEVSALNEDSLSQHQRILMAGSLQRMRQSRLTITRTTRRNAEELAAHKSDALPR